MRRLAEALAACEETRSRTRKVEVLAAALAAVGREEPAALPFAARLVTGALLPAGDPRTLGVGWSLLAAAVREVTGWSDAALGARARATGDLGTAVGEAVAEALEGGRMPGTGLRLADAETTAAALADTGAREEKLAALASALAATTPLEARYLTRAIVGEMRVGAKEGVVLDAIGAAFGGAPADVRRAAGIVTDVGELARLAAEGRLAEAVITPGRPLGFMLATPLETAKGVDLSAPHVVEDKIDGVRAQVHVTAEGVWIFARGKGPVTIAFPDVALPLAAGATRGDLRPAILDGEIVVTAEGGRPRPFSALQPRLGRTAPSPELVGAHPVVLLVYDLLWEAGESLLDLPFAARRARLEAWATAAPSPVHLHAQARLAADAVDAAFEDARARGWEGLVLKRLDAPYAAGVRGFAWLKVKKAFATLDVVVVAAERGHGRRSAVLSDYTFAVKDDAGALLPVGKAYSGLTDAEIEHLTTRLRALATAEEHHGRIPVRPDLVLEVAFDGIQRSDRHASGYALRFPRIARIREDKRPEDVSTVADVRALYEAQIASGHREDETAKDRRARAPPAPRGRKSGRKPDVRGKSKQLKLFDD